MQRATIVAIGRRFQSLPHGAIIGGLQQPGFGLTLTLAAPSLGRPIHVSVSTSISTTIPMDLTPRYLNPAATRCSQEAFKHDRQLFGMIQMTSTNNKQENLEFAIKHIRLAKERGAVLVFLPEAFDFIAANKAEGDQLCEPLNGPILTSYRNLAKELGIWLSLGGFHLKKEDGRDASLPQFTNCHLIINSSGDIVESYDKVHLFDVDNPENKITLKESAAVIPGDKIVTPVGTPLGKIGLGICYDLRFPDFSARLRQKGADILTYPSAFTVPTGAAHWISLLRARAIENQTYVVAAAQVGRHNEKRSSYGHSVAINPWGEILVEGDSQETGLLLASCSPSFVTHIRKGMPVLDHRRPDVYGLESAGTFVPKPEDREFAFPFGQVTVKTKFVFLETFYCRAFVNRKCVVPGHVLVTSKRPVERLRELTEAEVSDLFRLVQKVEIVMEEMHGARASTVAVQDGEDAGQSIKHVHVHILPRQPMDFDHNDRIYQKLASHDKGEEVKWRDDSDMEAECQKIRTHITVNHNEFVTMAP